jgi:hypothetical protein
MQAIRQFKDDYEEIDRFTNGEMQDKLALQEEYNKIHGNFIFREDKNSIIIQK